MTGCFIHFNVIEAIKLVIIKLYIGFLKNVICGMFYVVFSKYLIDKQFLIKYYI